MLRSECLFLLWISRGFQGYCHFRYRQGRYLLEQGDIRAGPVVRQINSFHCSGKSTHAYQPTDGVSCR